LLLLRGCQANHLELNIKELKRQPILGDLAIFGGKNSIIGRLCFPQFSTIVDTSNGAAPCHTSHCGFDSFGYVIRGRPLTGDPELPELLAPNYELHSSALEISSACHNTESANTKEYSHTLCMLRFLVVACLALNLDLVLQARPTNPPDSVLVPRIGVRGWRAS
jgi:hypothetical protein